MVERKEGVPLADRFITMMCHPNEIAVCEAEKQSCEYLQEEETNPFIWLVSILNIQSQLVNWVLVALI